MDNLIYVLPTLICPLVMGLMMWLMMRPGRNAATDAAITADQQELIRLRKEIDALRGAQVPQVIAPTDRPV